MTFSGLLGLLVGLSLLLGHIDGRYVSFEQPEPWRVELPSGEVIPYVAGTVTCGGDTVRVDLFVGASVEVLVHEFAHVWDCLDDGVAGNGSPLPEWADTSIVPWTQACRRDRAELYACWYTAYWMGGR